ncbi:MAG: HAMP domain-containing protein [Anaerolineales bacterium]
MNEDSPWRRWYAILWKWVGGVNVRTKIFGIVLGSTLLLSLSFIFQVRLIMFRYLATQAQLQGTSIAHDVSARATDLILINDLYGLNRLLLDTQNNFRDVRYIFIISKDGEVLAHTFSGGFPVDLITANAPALQEDSHTVVLQSEEGLVWDIAMPVFDGRLGVARVGISDQFLQETLGMLISQMGLTVVLVLVFSLLTATFMTWVLTRPILALVEATEHVGLGDFSVRVAPWADDEIGDLANAFNRMAADLARLDEIRAERETLRKQLLEGVINAQEEERRRIARELHDSASQSLTSLKVGLRTLEMQVVNEEIRPQVADLHRIAGQTLDDIHTLAVQLRPIMLDDLGLEAALTRLVDEWQTRYHIPVDVLVRLGTTRLTSQVEVTLYRITQEGLTNIARHAQAHQVSILIERRDSEVLEIIDDDGVGFDRVSVHQGKHLGLLGIRERVELLGGQFSLESVAGQGTSLFVRIPLHEVQP